jgi:hypothetical protein
MELAVIQKNEKKTDVKVLWGGQKYKPNREDVFITNYIKNNFDGTKAALETFAIGSQGGKNASATAAGLAWEYLRKPKVQEKLQERMSQLSLSKEWIMQRYKEVGSGKTNQYTLPALDRLAYAMGIEVKPSEIPQGTGNTNVQIVLGLPTDSLPAPKTEVIDASPAQ